MSALLKELLMSVHNVRMLDLIPVRSATTTSETKARRRAYSIKSCPSSESHKLCICSNTCALYKPHRYTALICEKRKEELLGLRFAEIAGCGETTAEGLIKQVFRDFVRQALEMDIVDHL